MPHILCQVRLQFASNLATDAAINTFSFNVADVSQTTLEVVAARLLNFYNIAGPGATTPITAFMSPEIITSTSRLKMYNRSDAKPRVPIYDEPFPITPSGTEGLPTEVALCCSFRGPAASGVPMARRRGRVFLGPFSKGSVGGSGSSGVRPSAGIRTAALGGARSLMDASNAQADWEVWSSLAVPSFASVVHAWVDDAWDTIRSRGPKPLIRSSADRSATLP